VKFSFDSFEELFILKKLLFFTDMKSNFKTDSVYGLFVSAFSGSGTVADLIEYLMSLQQQRLELTCFVPLNETFQDQLSRNGTESN